MISSFGSHAISSPLRPPRPLVSTALTVSAASRTASVRLAYCFPSRTAYPAAVSAATRSGVTPTRARTPIVMIAPSKPKRTRHNDLPAWHHDKNSLRDTLRSCTVMSFVVTSSADRTQSLPASLSAFLCGCLGYGRSAATLLTPSASHPPLLPPGRRGGCDWPALHPTAPPACLGVQLRLRDTRSAAVTLHCAIASPSPPCQGTSRRVR